MHEAAPFPHATCVRHWVGGEWGTGRWLVQVRTVNGPQGTFGANLWTGKRVD
jgi:hypothetical protein